MLVICPSLPKAIPEDNQRFWLKNQWPRSWGRAQAQHWRVGWASTNTLHFWIAWGRSAATLAVLTCLRSKGFSCFVNFGQWWRVFFMGNEISMEFATTCYRPYHYSLLGSTIQSPSSAHRPITKQRSSLRENPSCLLPAWSIPSSKRRAVLVQISCVSDFRDSEALHQKRVNETFEQRCSLSLLMLILLGSNIISDEKLNFIFGTSVSHSLAVTQIVLGPIEEYNQSRWLYTKLWNNLGNDSERCNFSVISFFLIFAHGYLAIYLLTLDLNIQLPLFWSPWCWALGQDSFICVGHTQWL